MVPSTALLYIAFKDKMAECSDSMYECSICGNRSTDLQVLLMHSCSSITGGLLYNDLITVSVPFKISLSGVSYCFQNNFARFSRSTLFSDVGTDSLPNSIEESLIISPALSSDTSNKRRSLEKWEDKKRSSSWWVGYLEVGLGEFLGGRLYDIRKKFNNEYSSLVILGSI